MISALYVDDEPSLLSICKVFLEQQGEFTVDTAQLAQDALARIGTRNYDAIISDYQMPDMDGIQFLKTVRAAGTDIPFIIFTGRGREEVVIDALNNGADFYLQKGGDPKAQFAELAHTIQVAVERRRTKVMLRETKRKYQTLFDHVADSIFLADIQGKLVDVNTATCRQLGYGRDELLGMQLKDITPASHEAMAIRMKTVIQGGQVTFESVHRHRDGHMIPVEIEMTLMEHDGQRLFLGVGRDITDRKKAEAELRTAYEQLMASEEKLRGQYDALAAGEKALRESEERYRLLVNNTEFPVVVTGIESGKALFINECASRFFGVLPDELAHQHTPDYWVNPDDRNRFVRELLAKGNLINYETELKTKGGEVRWTLINASIIDFAGERAAFIVYNDITGRKQAEAELRASEKKYRNLVETTSDFIWETDAATVYTYASPKVRDLLGFEPAELIGRSPFELMPPVEAERVAAEFNRFAAEGKPFAGLENRNIRKDGREVIFETSGVPLLDANGLLTGYRGIDRDITERKSAEGELRAANERLAAVEEELRKQYRELARSEQQLRESGEQLRTILASAQTGIVLIDAETHRILEANPKALEIIGAARDSVIGAVCHQFICPSELGKCPVTDLNQTFDASERTVLTAEDRKIPVLKTVVNAHIGGKKVLVESFIDITEQKRAEEALRRANAQLNLLNSVNRHDIANQLTVLQGYTQLARMKKPEPVIADFLRKIDEASDVIARQLEFTRTYQDLGMHAPGWHNLSAIIGKVQPEHVAVTMTCPDTEIFADPMLENVFANLFDNSIRHGRCVTEITVSCEPVPNGYMVTVRDNGAGIPLNEKDKIFSKGYGRHTGFGLFLAREILAITGISIHETGKHGRGARFEITVPRGGYRCSGQAKDT